MQRLILALAVVALTTTAPVATAACSSSTTSDAVGSATLTQTHNECFDVYSDPNYGVSAVSSSDSDEVTAAESTTGASVTAVRAQGEYTYSSPGNLQSAQGNQYSAFGGASGVTFYGSAYSSRYTYNGVCNEYAQAYFGLNVLGIGWSTGAGGWPTDAPCVPAQAHDALP